ncbi:uncharacterized protein SAPINGB_P005655 [Magnusiomyces paraingens]|uniref:Hyphally-regulated cell wall protein N-terminal domain-containing protein n=1 Tax=Magnusiomyces paraingens TaxID=2606893 RepID=A0A5E8C0A3_9ASCO|nr:uncharacterized protein SAPINGB_P005655 [Saprochaete ingens]VVT57299.1 unnamed protein product [Saprochaete ingens]
MRSFSQYFILLLITLVGVIKADSPTFTLYLNATGTKLDGYSLYLSDDGRFYISQSSKSITGYIRDDTKFVVEGNVTGDGRNFLSTQALSSAWKECSPWTVVDGVLELYGLYNFHVFPEGSVDDLYVLGTGNAVGGGVEYRTLVTINPVLSDGSVLQTWPETSSSSSVSSVASTSQVSSTPATTASSVSVNSVASSSIASSSVASSSVASSSVASSSVASSSVASSSVASSSVASTSVASTSVASTSVASTSVASTSVASTSVASTSVAATSSVISSATVSVATTKSSVSHSASTSSVQTSSTSNATQSLIPTSSLAQVNGAAQLSAAAAVVFVSIFAMFF